MEGTPDGEGESDSGLGFGLLAGVLTGFALAMIFVEPYWITPDSAARRYVAIAGIGGAMAVMVVRNRLAGRHPSPGGPSAAEPGTAPGRPVRPQ